LKGSFRGAKPIISIPTHRPRNIGGMAVSGYPTTLYGGEEKKSPSVPL
jgi:hypothetical protein